VHSPKRIEIENGFESIAGTLEEIDDDFTESSGNDDPDDESWKPAKRKKNK
jgi:hypothetical protein